jgi:hypothetical protein
VAQHTDFTSRLNAGFARVGAWSYDHRWWVVALAVSLTALSAGLASQVRIDNSYENYFDSDDTTFLDYETYRDDFGSDEISYILYEAPERPHGPWDIDVMRRIVELTEVLESEVPFIYEVNSLANAELMVGVPDGIEIRELADNFPADQDALLVLRDRYLAKPMFVDGLLSRDARAAAIVIQMDRSSTDPLDEIRLDPDGGDELANLYPQPTAAAIEEILARPQWADIRFYHSGDVPMNALYNELIGNESGVLQMLTSAVIAALLAFFFRSFVGVIGPIAVVQLSVLMVVGFVALIGWELDMSFGSAPTLLTAIGVAHSVHILSEFRARLAAVGDRREALIGTLERVGAPCLLTSVTTAVGFLAMFFVPIPSISHMAVFNAFGVLAAFVLSFTLLMAFLSFGSREPKNASSDDTLSKVTGDVWMQRALAAIAGFVLRRRIALLATFAAIFVASAAGISQVIVDSNWLNDFSDEVELKQATLYLDNVMGGVTNIILLFDGGAPETVQEPAVLREIERLQNWANDRGGLVRKTNSIVDILKDLNQSFHADDPAYFALPDSRELVSQYLLLYETAGGSEGDEYISSDYRRASLMLRLKLEPTSHTAALVTDLQAELDARPLQATTLTVTGIGALWVKLLDYIVSSQIRGFLIAFSMIGLLMCLLFGSLKTGLISMLPNLSPVILTLGVMGWTGIELDYNKVSIAAVAMGIAVDDTIHLMARFRFEFQRLGDYREALFAAFRDVGRALVITSVALVCGFLVLLQSTLDSQATYGVLLAATIVTALVADFLLMPALILTLEPFGPEGVRSAQTEPIREAA